MDQLECVEPRILPLYASGFPVCRQVTLSPVCGLLGQERQVYARVTAPVRTCHKLDACCIRHTYICMFEVFFGARTYHLPTACVLLGHIGPMWARQSLFRGLARVVLHMARIPQLWIESFQFHLEGLMAWDNRPLTCFNPESISTVRC